MLRRPRPGVAAVDVTTIFSYICEPDDFIFENTIVRSERELQ